MANIASQKKRNKQNEKARIRNKSVRSEVKTSLRRVDEAVAEGEPDAVTDSARKAQKALGVAARKGVLHKRKVARAQSQLARKVSTARTSG
ncbi:MAG: 30S ribosomal protein S20 [Actinobacteria bacterium ATB1]|nr:30S ribosomal protein S20 [Actinobacteria bacterium ATB1]